MTWASWSKSGPRGNPTTDSVLFEQYCFAPSRPALAILSVNLLYAELQWLQCVPEKFTGRLRALGNPAGPLGSAGAGARLCGGQGEIACIAESNANYFENLRDRSAMLWMSTMRQCGIHCGPDQ